VTVIVPVRLAAAVLAVTFSVSVPLFAPLAGDTVNHDVALLDAVHDMFEVTFTAVISADAGAGQDSGDTSSTDVTNTPACATVTVLIVPPPDTVTVPVRLTPVFSVTANKRKPLPVPLGGKTVSHEALLDAVHAVSDVSIIAIVPADADGVHDVGYNSSGPSEAAFPNIFK